MHWCVSVGEFINGNPLLINTCSRSSTVASCGGGGSSFSSYYLHVHFANILSPSRHALKLPGDCKDWLNMASSIVFCRCYYFSTGRRVLSILCSSATRVSVRASAHLSQFLAAKSTSSLLLCWCYCLQHWTVVVVAVLYNIQQSRSNGTAAPQWSHIVRQ